MEGLDQFLSGQSKPTVRAEVGIDTQSILIAMGVIITAGIVLILFYRLVTMPDRAKK